MNIYDLKTILNAFWFRTIIFFILGFAIAYHFSRYKKGVKVAFYYGRGFLFILIGYIIQTLISPLKPGSPLDIFGFVAIIFFLIIAGYNISYLTSKKKQTKNK